MFLVKLQLIATACVAPQFKVRWLENWNSSVHSCQAVHFPPKEFTNKDFEAWLNKASFWAGVSRMFASYGAHFLGSVFCAFFCINFYFLVQTTSITLKK